MDFSRAEISWISAFNRTNVELKFRSHQRRNIGIHPFNRTNVELKFCPAFWALNLFNF